MLLTGLGIMGVSLGVIIVPIISITFGDDEE